MICKNGDFLKMRNNPKTVARQLISPSKKQYYQGRENSLGFRLSWILL